MSKRITVFVLFMFTAVGCDNTNNPLEGTKWLIDDNVNTEYVHFTSDMVNDYYFDNEFICFTYDQYQYSIDGSQIFLRNGADSAYFQFHITDGILTIINTVEIDTVIFLPTNFDADTLDICSPVKRLGKSFFKK